MKLHFRGIEVPALGSLRDVAYRDFMIYEAKLEAKKQQLQLLIAHASPALADDNARRTWDKLVNGTFNEYVALLLGEDGPIINHEEVHMQEFYDKVVKDTAPVLKKDKSGKLTVTGLPKL